MDIQDLLKLTIDKGASDLHITEGAPPILRIDGKLVSTDSSPLSGENTKDMIYNILSDEQKVEFEENWELDFSFAIPDLGRFRVNVHLEKGNVEAAFRSISLNIRTLKDLEMPSVVTELSRKPNGLVLITGPTGVGKTTTLAAMIDLINNERASLIITVEDPIEYLHNHKKSIVKQREVHSDTKSFANALKHVLRQDPDVICVGEMRDLETISTALTAAETGHLVLTTLHTPDVAQTVDRIIDVFPPHQQQQVRIQLAGSIQGIISQQLFPKIDRTGRIVATEILVATPAVRNVIREQKTEQISTILQTGGKFGMHTMDKSIKELYQRGAISYEVATSKVKNPSEFKKL